MAGDMPRLSTLLTALEEAGLTRFAAWEHALFRPPPTPQPLRHRFALGRHRFEILVTAEPGQATQLRLTGVLGRLPYSAEDGRGRQAALQALSACNRVGIGRFGLDERQICMLIAEEVLPAPATALDVITAVTARLLALKPLFDLLEPRLVRV